MSTRERDPLLDILTDPVVLVPGDTALLMETFAEHGWLESKRPDWIVVTGGHRS